MDFPTSRYCHYFSMRCPSSALLLCGGLFFSSCLVGSFFVDAAAVAQLKDDGGEFTASTAVYMYNVGMSFFVVVKRSPKVLLESKQ